MATNNQLPNCPPLRFPEFNDEWERTTLGEICQIVGGGTPSTEIDKYWGGNISWFTPSEIQKKYIGNSVRTITEEGLNNSGAKLLPKGTILLTTRATIGECSISTIPCCTNQGFQSLVVNLDKSSTEFIYQKVQTLRNELLIRANGSTFKEITAQEIRGIHIVIPTLEEQSKIANFLSLLDERIEAQRQTIKERKKQKKALLQQIFSQTLRFPEFEDEWQQTTLGEISEFKKGSPISKEQLSEHGNPVILYGELYTTYKNEVISSVYSKTK
ncbi:MAG: restriction endonuclease subunit S, partial [Alloprevotella sp.]|nr:restriction endonuclease subunit S [Alloprevotella sp.]